MKFCILGSIHPDNYVNIENDIDNKIGYYQIEDLVEYRKVNWYEE